MRRAVQAEGDAVGRPSPPESSPRGRFLNQLWTNIVDFPLFGADSSLLWEGEGAVLWVDVGRTTESTAKRELS